MSTLAQREMLSDSTFGELRKIAHKESAVYMKDHLRTALLFNDDLKYWAHVFKKIPDHGLIMEFGVLEGRSIDFFAGLLQKANDNRIIYGFDSFEGFSEEWGGTFASKDYFSHNGIIPEVKDNVRLIIKAGLRKLSPRL